MKTFKDVLYDRQKSIRDLAIMESSGNMQEMPDHPGLFTDGSSYYRRDETGEFVDIMQPKIWNSSNIPEYQKLVTQMEYTLGNLSKRFPFFNTLRSKLTLVYTNYQISTAATDGVRLYISPEFYIPLNNDDRLAIFCHELLHCALGHFARLGNRDRKLWNFATDYVINYILAHEDIDGKTVWSKEAIEHLGCLYDAKWAGMSEEQIYEELAKSQPPSQGQSGSGGQGQGQGQGQGAPGEMPEDGSLDDTMTPAQGRQLAKKIGYQDDDGEDQGQGQGQGQGEDQGQGQGQGQGQSQAASDISDAALDENWKKWTETAKREISSSQSSGTGAGGFLIDALNRRLRPQVDWKKELQRFIGKAASTWTHKFPSRRWIAYNEYRYKAKQAINGLSTAVIAIDTSGSISSNDLDHFLAEALAIINKNHIEKTYIVWWDSSVESVDILKKGSKSKNKLTAKGGGGTVYKCAHDWIDNKKNLEGKEPDLVIVMTDGYLSDGPIPAPKWEKKVIWLIINNPSYERPYGAKTLYLEKNAFKK